MLTPSKKLYYAIEAVLFIAYNAKALPIPGSAVAEAQGLPTRYLEPIMQKLVRAGILKGMRGPTGGYMLGRERRRISLADIYGVISEATLPRCASELGERILSPKAEELMGRWNEVLASLTIADLCEEATLHAIPLAQSSPTDFAI